MFRYPPEVRLAIIDMKRAHIMRLLPREDRPLFRWLLEWRFDMLNEKRAYVHAEMQQYQLIT